MAGFQKITIIVAIIILIVSLALIGVLMYNTQSENVYPPIEPGCPAYWMMKSDDQGRLTCVPPAGDSIPGYSTDKVCREPLSLDLSSKISRCAALEMAKKCNWSWDGVTNTSNPCEGLED